MNQLLATYHAALERIATLDGIKGFEETDLMTASSQLFSLVCKLKNIAKTALNTDGLAIEDKNIIDGEVDDELKQIVAEANTCPKVG